MTIDEMAASRELLLTPAEVAPILSCDPNVIRRQAQDDPSKLGFPVCVLGSRVKIPRVPFLRFLGWEV